MQFYNKINQSISLFCLLIIVCTSLSTTSLSQDIDIIRTKSFANTHDTLLKTNNSIPVIIKLNIYQNLETESKVLMINQLANKIEITVDSYLLNLNSFISTISTNDLAKLKNVNYVELVTPYQSYSAPLNIQQNSTKIGTKIVQDYDNKLIPVYHQAIGLNNANSNQSMTGKGQVIALIDTGVDFTQPELEGTSLTEACFSDVSKEYGIKSYSNCPNGKTTMIGKGASKPCLESLAFGCSHGTHVAGIIAGKKTSRNHAGIAPEAKLVSVNVFHIIENEARCNPQNASKLKKDNTIVSKCIYTSNLAYLKAIDFIIEQNKATPIAALNMSLGSNETKGDDCNDMDTPNFQSVMKNNISLIIASGNSGNKTQMSHPACQSKIVSVGAYDEDTKTDAFFSNVSPKTTLFATGTSIKSVGYSMSGTSMATPMVSGTIALLKQAGLEDIQDITNNLIDNGSNFNSDTTVNGKLINIEKSLKAAISKPKETIVKTKESNKAISKSPIITSKCTSGQPGWCAKYYNNKTLSGKAVVTKAIPTLNIYNQRVSAEKGVYADKFSAIYTAKFSISKSSENTFRYNFDDGVRVTLIVDGYEDIVIDEWKNQAPKFKEYTTFLDSGDYTIKVEYYDNLLGSTRMLDIVNKQGQLVQFQNI